MARSNKDKMERIKDARDRLFDAWSELVALHEDAVAAWDAKIAEIQAAVDSDKAAYDETARTRAALIIEIERKRNNLEAHSRGKRLPFPKLTKTVAQLIDEAVGILGPSDLATKSETDDGDDESAISAPPLSAELGAAYL